MHIYKFKHIVDRLVKQSLEGKEFIPGEITLCYKDQNDSFSVLPTNYYPLVDLNLKHIIFLYNNYKYLLDEEKTDEIEERENKINYLNSIIQKSMNEVDDLLNEIDKLK